MAEPTLAIVVLTALAAKGFALAIDDFGTGFSSLAYLRDLPVSWVKVDKSFVMDLANYVPDAHIVRGIVDLVHGLGKRVIAEGVETTGGLAFLLLPLEPPVACLRSRRVAQRVLRAHHAAPTCH
jgi:EAL domain-containing protein (putative c-di-GMP-specific phosphodiesterase class I)